MKWNKSRPGFELVSPCPFPPTITITPRLHFVYAMNMHTKFNYILLSINLKPVIAHIDSYTFYLSIYLSALFFSSLNQWSFSIFLSVHENKIRFLVLAYNLHLKLLLWFKCLSVSLRFAFLLLSHERLTLHSILPLVVSPTSLVSLLISLLQQLHQLLWELFPFTFGFLHLFLPSFFSNRHTNRRHILFTHSFVRFPSSLMSFVGILIDFFIDMPFVRSLP